MHGGFSLSLLPLLPNLVLMVSPGVLAYHLLAPLSSPWSRAPCLRLFQLSPGSHLYQTAAEAEDSSTHSSFQNCSEDICGSIRFSNLPPLLRAECCSCARSFSLSFQIGPHGIVLVVNPITLHLAFYCFFLVLAPDVSWHRLRHHTWGSTGRSG